MLVRTPLVEAEQDRCIRIQDLTEVVVTWRRLGLAEERLVPSEAGGDIAYANDRPCTFHRMNAHMKPDITGIAPFFIVKNVPAALSFYCDRLGFDITFQGPDPDDIFFGIVQRGAAMIMFKDVGVDPVPNYTRDIKQGIARWARISMSRIPTRWPQNSRRAMSSFPNHSKTPAMRGGDSNSRILTATSCCSLVLVHERTMEAGT